MESMSKTIKIIYYVDVDDNTKGALIAFPSDKDLRDFDTIKQIGQALHNANFGEKIGISNSIAYEIAHNGSAEETFAMGNYEFGIEETELFE